jgi:hypothetical protein
MALKIKASTAVATAIDAKCLPMIVLPPCNTQTAQHSFGLLTWFVRYPHFLWSSDGPQGTSNRLDLTSSPSAVIRWGSRWFRRTGV